MVRRVQEDIYFIIYFLVSFCLSKGESHRYSKTNKNTVFLYLDTLWKIIMRNTQLVTVEQRITSADSRLSVNDTWYNLISLEKKSPNLNSLKRVWEDINYFIIAVSKPWLRWNSKRHLTVKGLIGKDLRQDACPINMHDQSWCLTSHAQWNWSCRRADQNCPRWCK